MKLLNLDTLKGKLIEVHGSENINLSKQIAPQIASFQKENSAIVYYVDAGASLNFRDMPYNWELLFTTFGLNDETLRGLEPAAEYVDVIVIDSLPYYEGSTWDLLAMLRSIARKHNIAIIVLNQYRYVYNHQRCEYEYLPYRYNAVARHASLAIDADTDSMTWFEPQKAMYEPFVETLLRRAS